MAASIAGSSPWLMAARRTGIASPSCVRQGNSGIVSRGRSVRVLRSEDAAQGYAPAGATMGVLARDSVGS